MSGPCSCITSRGPFIIINLEWKNTQGDWRSCETKWCYRVAKTAWQKDGVWYSRWAIMKYWYHKTTWSASWLLSKILAHVTTLERLMCIFTIPFLFLMPISHHDNRPPRRNGCRFLQDEWFDHHTNNTSTLHELYQFSQSNILIYVQGFAKYLQKMFPNDIKSRGVIIGYDARHNSTRLVPWLIFWSNWMSIVHSTLCLYPNRGHHSGWWFTRWFSRASQDLYSATELPITNHQFDITCPLVRYPVLLVDWSQTLFDPQTLKLSLTLAIRI